MSDTDSMSEQFEDTQEFLEESLHNMRGTITSFLDQTAALLETSYRPTYPAVAPRSSLNPYIGPSVEVNTPKVKFGTQGQSAPQYPGFSIHAGPRTPMIARRPSSNAVPRPELKLPSMFNFSRGDHPATFIKEFLAMTTPLQMEDDMLIQLFPSYLIGSTEKWYYQQCGGNFDSFDDLTSRFISHFSTYPMADLPEEQSRMIAQGSEESFWSFMGRWADAGGTSLTEKDQIKTVLAHLNYEYKLAMATQPYSSLGELISAGRRFDEMAYGHIPSTVRHVKLSKYDVGSVSTVGTVSDFNHWV